MIYKWKEGAVQSIPAQVAGEELERIRVRHNGRLDPAYVVDASRKRSAPLHDAFEWDDAIAAKGYRLDQARSMIRHIAVIMETPSRSEAPVRAFVSVVRGADRSYTSTAHALSDAELRAQVVTQAWRELEAWRKRYAELVELAEVFAVIDQARAA